MQSRKAIIIFAGACIMVSFLLGNLSLHYRIFPFQQDRLTNPLTNYYDDKVSFFDHLGRNDYDIVFIGDSLTDGAEWNDLFPSLKIANRGINGDSTRGVLARMDNILNTNARIAFIMLGINDLDYGLEVKDVFENYQAIVQLLEAKGMAIFIQSTILGGQSKVELNDRIKALNQLLQEYAVLNESVVYIDLNAGLSPNAVLSPNFTSDDVHLNGSGYHVWRDLIKPYIE